MLKKLLFAMLIVTLVAAPVTGIAFAQDDTPPGKREGDRRGRLGQVTAIGSEGFTFQTLNGEELTVQVTAETAFRFQDGSEASFGDLSVGRWVAGAGEINDDGTAVARLVVILPEDFDPEDFKPVQYGGEVDKINNGQDTFSLVTQEGETLTFSVDENTRYFGSIAELQDLEKGMQVGVAAIEQEDGTLLAKVVGNRRPDGERGQRAAGLVAATGASSLTITTRNGELTFSITGETQFHSQDDDVNGLDDLEVDDVVGVAYQDQDGTLTALAVFAGDEIRDRLSRAGGTVQSAGGSHLTINTRDGETLSFTVDENTRIQSRDGSVQDLNNLKNGDPVLVVYLTQEDGTLLAKGIVTGEPDPNGKQIPHGDLPSP